MKKLLYKIWDKQKKWSYENETLLRVFVCLVILDQVTKIAARCYLQKNPIEIFSYFWLNYVENTGAAFGILQHGNSILIFIMLLVMAYIVWNWKELVSYGSYSKWGAVLILAGAFGNLFDRITLGYVVDFLDFRVWPVFNVADSLITIGACLLGITFLRNPHKKVEEK